MDDGFAVRATVTQATKALYRWANENGYTLGSDHGWNFQTVPKGEVVATVEVCDIWKAEPSGRWRMMRLSDPQRPAPDLVIQIVGTEKPVQSEVGISSNAVDTGSVQQKQWQGIVKGLSDAVKKAADIDPAKPVETPGFMQAAGWDWPAPLGMAG